MGLLIKPEGLKGIQMTLMNLHHIGISCKSTLLYLERTDIPECGAA